MKLMILLLALFSAALARASDVRLTWTNNPPVGTSVEIERGVAAVPPAVQTWAKIATVTGTPLPAMFLDVNVPASTTLVYRIRAVGPGGNSAYSNTATTTTPIAPPAAPSGLTPANELTMKWSIPPDKDLIVTSKTVRATR